MNPEHQGAKPITSFLVTIGCGLIAVGILFLIYSSWGDFSPAGRVATVTLPLLFLYGVSAAIWNKSGFRTIAEQILLAGNVILPAVVGVLYYQLSIYRPNDSGLVFWSFLTALPVVLLCQYLIKEKRHVYLTVTYSIALVLLYWSH